MKKAISLLIVLALAATMLSVQVSAATWKIDENPTIELTPSTPTIDGTIDKNEGWSEKAMLDEMTVGYFGLPFQLLTASSELYFATSDEGLYFGANYVDQGAAYCVKFYEYKGDEHITHIRVYADPNTPNYSAEPGKFPEVTPDGTQLLYYRIDDYTWSAPDGVLPDAVFWRTSTEVYGGLNTVEPSTDTDYLDQGMAGWNGDVLGLSLDPLSLFNTNGFEKEVAPLYCFSLFDDGSVRVARSCSHANGEVTADCKTAGKLTDHGFVIEAFIPWTRIIDDLNTEAQALGFDHTFTKDELTADGALHRAAVTLYDRLYSNELDDVDTCGRYVTACAMTDAGVPGYLSSGITFDAMGLKIKMNAPAGEESESNAESESSAPESGSETSGSSGSQVTTSRSAVTTKSAGTGGKSGGNGSSAQTFDAGIAVFVGLLAVSGIAAVYIAKKPRG